MPATPRAQPRLGRLNVRQRLFVTTLGLLVLCAGALVSVVLWSFERFYLASAATDLGARTHAIAQTAGDLLEQGDLVRLRVLIERYGAPDDIALRVIAPDGRLLATSQHEPAENAIVWPTVPGMAEALAGRAVTGIAPGLIDVQDRIYHAVPIVRGDRQLGVVRMSRSLAQLQAHTRATVISVLAALAVILAVGAGLVAWFARGLAWPIQQMRDFAVALGRGEFGTRLAIARPDELGDLAAELNRMAERLAALEGERRSFLANASHELRTPVSNLHVTLQALDGGAGDDPELRTRFLRTAVDETTRLRTLIQDLLDLGHLEAGSTRLACVDSPLRAVLERATRAVEGRALDRGVSLVVDLDEELTVCIDPERIAQALLCVLDNALKFSPRGGGIEVIARRRGHRVEVVVRDQGPGIADSDRPHVFEQFYTADPARRRGGSGLGLAIARRIVDAHGGTIHVGASPGRGAALVITLPLAAPVPV
ncbi:HAMP domain-containing sensor histidine kinase [Nannocystis sp. ILAH1]|uniref:sensor histidine kinase n=1 Tax=Nannocystis sp. ILAH1 TaxID=2996789 RepID=UPI002271AFC1|nr:HAMP domain-containing sensor histidine kinase [Nannocystis sp. ILAH1]MCY0987778.1 HAMP domain-containing sensor histidine kinase [Nannocystis sp. ILAH1]